MQAEHKVSTPTNHDEFARQEFVRSYKQYLVKHVHGTNQLAYEKRVKPKIKHDKGRDPQNRFEVRDEMVADPQYQMFSTLLRTSQEMMWSSCQIPVQRNLKDLNKKINKRQKTTLGSLRLDPELKTPGYHTAVDIHCMPGGYHSEFDKNDASAGMVYDRAVHIYAMGQMGPYNDDIGASIALWLKENHPKFQPVKILDLGCSVGNSTVPYVDTFPKAEVYALDVAAPMLRYGHARAEDMGRKIHFSQQNAESTDFEDESFDLIVSHILLHETSNKAIKNIISECHRLLKKDGMMVHAETPQYKGMDPFDAFMLDWDTRNNNEPFWAGSHEIDLGQLSREGGFDPDKNFETMIPSAFQVAEAKRSLTFQGGDFGGGGFWFVYGNKK
ncbi:MAG TPA: class I SAM-dependent methyltransferase [Gammaproteobacteria bacterium]|nr:class I SAM-dependent methyltransferase [Gammaproteobacteria bacterium]|tara:strand:- start:2409 stop:3563 length:1155 start_codon:yes stop_codon:yes gene_type:complete